MRWGWVCLAGWLMASVVLAAEPAATAPVTGTKLAGPLAPAEALKAFQLDPALTIELVAAEPEVVDPVAISFSADGRLWVVEMRDYPHGPAEGEAPRSRIKRLTDTNGDGQYETATIFAEQILFITGVLPYRDGLIVTAAGRILFLADRDGDGKADVQETWFSGFAQDNSQLRANHPTLGLDGYVYVANGLRGGKVVAERPEWKKSSEPLSITGFDFRFHPETGDFSTVAGHGQFGMTMDDYGRRFVCSNRNPCQHIVLEDRYTRASPEYGVSKVMHDVCAPAEFSQLYPISKAWTTSTLHANQFTAACGVLLFRGDALPESFRGNAFTCDPTGNLVHREIVSPLGPTFTGQSAYERREFLASPDTWFRPVNLAHGPDGSLYVVDMYRAVIEHPDFMPDELKRRPDLLLGNDRGRIYRVRDRQSATGARTALAGATNAQLLSALGHSNAFQRETAFRLLLERKPDGLAPALADAATSSISPVARSLALRLLASRAEVSDDLLQAALNDAAPEVRETATQLSEGKLTSPAIRQAVLKLAGDDSARVRFQAVQTLTLGPSDAELANALLEVAGQDAGNIWSTTAIMMAVREQAATVLVGLLKRPPQGQQENPGFLTLMEELSQKVAWARFQPQRPDVLAGLGGLEAPSSGKLSVAGVRRLRWAVLQGWGEGLRRQGFSLLTDPAMTDADKSLLTSWLQEACDCVADVKADRELRGDAIKLIRWAPPAMATPLLMNVALTSTDETLPTQALLALAALGPVQEPEPLLEKFPSASPALRRGILDVLMASPSGSDALLSALEQNRIRPAELDPARAQRLQSSGPPELRQRAQKLFQAAAAERGSVIAAYQPHLTAQSDPLRGRQLFAQQCATCHRIGDVGVNVGPDIGDTRVKTPEVLLQAILDPNRAVDNNYFGYTVVLNDGRVMTGIITAETAGSLTLRQPEGKVETVLRTDIDELRNTGASLMPVGFERTLNPQQMADLISFLKNWRYLDGDVPLSDAR